MMLKNFFKKLLELWLHGLIINGQNRAIAEQSLWLMFNKKL
jgi:hypothetical protein